MENQSCGYWRLWSNTLTKSEALKWIELFEPNTEKWFKLYDLIYGFSKRVSSFEDATLVLNSIYPEQSSSKIILKDVLLAIKELKKVHRYGLVNHLVGKNNLGCFGGQWAHSISHYLNILKRANIIFVEKGRFGKKKSFGAIIREVYIFNENVGEWRVPSRNIG